MDFQSASNNRGDARNNQNSGLTQNWNENYQVNISSTNFDLETITLSYTGLMRIYRLLYVADHCSSLRNDALLLSLKYIHNTNLIPLYKQVLEVLKNSNVPLPNDFDPTWCEKTQRNYSQKLEKLDSDLKSFRTNAIKDSIRRGHDDLGDHYLDAGDYFNAVRCYVRARDYCSTPKHLRTMCMNVIKASFFLQNWPNVLSYVNKAEQAMESAESTAKAGLTPSTTSSTTNPLNSTANQTSQMSDEDVRSRLKVYSGFAELANGRYKLAARNFISVLFENCSNRFQDLISPQTLAQYVCLCSLATFDRAEIHRLIIMSPNMKQYLEVEPSIRDILHKFYETSYSSSLALMSQYEPVFALDQYLAPHLHKLFHEIRHRIIITYFSPYKSASMVTMARQLNTTTDALEDELVHLIRTEKIKARIDSKNKILYVADTDQRWYAYQHGLAMVKQTEKMTRDFLLRSAIIKAKLHVKDETNVFPKHFSNNNQKFLSKQYVLDHYGNIPMDEGNLSDNAEIN